jgi:hypothetical protein
VSPGRLLERLDRRAIYFLSRQDREFVSEMLRTPGRQKSWPNEYRTAEARYLDNFGILLQEISDDELASVDCTGRTPGRSSNSRYGDIRMSYGRVLQRRLVQLESTINVPTVEEQWAAIQAEALSTLSIEASHVA